MSGLAVPVVPLTELAELYRYAQAIAAAYEQLGAAENDVGYSSGPSEAGPTSGGPGHGDIVSSRVYRTVRTSDDGEVTESAGISDAAVREWRATLSREARWIQRNIAKRTPRLFMELGWEHPNAERERAEGYREPDGRLRVVGS